MLGSATLAIVVSSTYMIVASMIEQVTRPLLTGAPAVAALIATHNMDLARRMHRVLRIEAGRLIEVSPAAVH